MWGGKIYTGLNNVGGITDIANFVGEVVTRTASAHTYGQGTQIIYGHGDTYLGIKGELRIYDTAAATVAGSALGNTGETRISGAALQVPVKTDGTRGAAGTAGRIIFNSGDGQLNIDDGTNWTLPDGTTT